MTTISDVIAKIDLIDGVADGKYAGVNLSEKTQSLTGTCLEIAQNPDRYQLPEGVSFENGILKLAPNIPHSIECNRNTILVDGTKITMPSDMRFEDGNGGFFAPNCSSRTTMLDILAQKITDLPITNTLKQTGIAEADFPTSRELWSYALLQLGIQQLVFGPASAEGSLGDVFNVSDETYANITIVKHFEIEKMLKPGDDVIVTNKTEAKAVLESIGIDLGN